MNPKRIEPSNRYLNEHPDDKASREQSSAIAVRIVDDFAKEHAEELLALLWTYGDRVAEEKLTALRELFWMDKRFDEPDAGAEETP
jgi:hypothetical protein